MPKAKSLSRPTYAEISYQNFQHNYQYIKSKCQNDFFCPMLKADAYGHDVMTIVPILIRMDCSWIGFATIEEAMQARDLGYQNNILVFAADYRNTNEILHKNNICPVISDVRHIKDLKNLKVHLKINTGMNRMGIHPEKIKQALNLCEKNKIKVVGLLSHFYEGRTLAQASSSARKQLELFNEIKDKYFQDVKCLHLHNSASCLTQFNNKDFGSRPGIALYGYSSIKDNQLKPVMRLVAKIVKLHHIKKGEIVSYEAKWKAVRDSVIGVLPIGYADGLSRSLSNQYKFICHGSEISQVGNICMDYCMVDLTDIQDKAHIYDPVILFGQNKIQVQEIANKLNTIPYEILTDISNRVPKLLVERFT